VRGLSRNGFWDFVEDPVHQFGCEGSYLFSCIRYQLSGVPHWVKPPDKDPNIEETCVIAWLELTDLDGTIVCEHTAKPDPNKKIHSLTGNPLVIVDFCFVAMLYSIRILRFGSFEDVERFFKLFHIEPFFRLPTEAKKARAVVPVEGELF
jgi:hypothetical protein